MVFLVKHRSVFLSVDADNDDTFIFITPYLDIVLVLFSPLNKLLTEDFKMASIIFASYLLASFCYRLRHSSRASAFIWISFLFPLSLSLGEASIMSHFPNIFDIILPLILVYHITKIQFITLSRMKLFCFHLFPLIWVSSLSPPLLQAYKSRERNQNTSL